MKFFLYGVLLCGYIIAVVIIKLLDSQGWFDIRSELKPSARLTVHSPRNTLLVQELQKLGQLGKVAAALIIRPALGMKRWIRAAHRGP